MRRIILFAIPLIAVLALFALFATQLGRDTKLVPSVMIDRPVPEFELAGLQNWPQPGFNTGDLTGGVAVVNVFASWCVPCRDEHEFLVQLAAQEDVTLYGINQKDQPDQAISFLQELGNPYDAIGADSNGRISIEWGVYGVPETFVVDATGTITYKHIGPISAQSYAESLIPAIRAAQGAGTN